MNKRILSLALPNIVTNITVPLLGMVDMAIVGHLSAAHIGAITIGTSIFNLIYWNFGFLRMGTSGFTAQAYGARNLDEAVRIFFRSMAVALAIALLLIVLQYPLALLSKIIFHSTPSVMQMALSYFFVRIWAAPATLGNYAVKGWFIGMQNSKLPMWIAIVINIVNILCSLLFVIVFHWDIVGVALGTVIAQYSGLAIGLFFVVKNYGKLFVHYWRRLKLVEQGSISGKSCSPFRSIVADVLTWAKLRLFFKVNADIFLRTICLAAVFTFITAASGRISDQVLAVDALLLQFFTLFSYIMDGFAYAGESLVGRYIGAADPRKLRLSVRLLIMWGLVVTVFFTILYAVAGEPFLRLFCSDESIIVQASNYLFWVLVVPVCGFSAFLFDGIFVGATASRTMRNSMFFATLAFFAIYYAGTFWLVDARSSAPSMLMLHNNILWTAFVVYLAMRGILQAVMLRKAVYSRADRSISTHSSQ